MRACVGEAAVFKGALSDEYTQFYKPDYSSRRNLITRKPTLISVVYTADHRSVSTPPPSTPLCNMIGTR